MFMQQPNPMAHRGGVPGGLSGMPGGVPAGFNQNHNALQGPLAYLEKTTSNIGKKVMAIKWPVEKWFFFYTHV